jgi:hypothetical protein
MLSKATSYFFVFLYLIAMLKPIAPYIEYALNQDYIANFLCVNKKKPELNCNGKCYLMKEVKKQEYPIGFVQIVKFSNKNTIDLSIKNTFCYKRNYSYVFSKLIFHPPTI